MIKKYLSVIASVLVICLLFVSCGKTGTAESSTGLTVPQTENTSQTHDAGNQTEGETVARPIMDSGKPCNGFYVETHYQSFYNEKAVTVDFFMSQDPRFGESYYYADFDGYPYFKAVQYLSNEEGDFPLDQYDGHRVILNGCEGEYEKRFSRDDLNTILGHGFSNLHKEEVTIDFSSFEVGESFSLILEYGYAFTDESLPDTNDGHWRRNFLHFYVGEKRVAVSHLSLKTAISSYDQNEQGLEGKEVVVSRIYSFLEGFGYFSFEKSAFFRPVSAETKTVPQGTVLTDRYELISFVPCEQYKIKIETSDGVNLIGDDEYYVTDPFIELSYQLTSDCSPYGTIQISVYGMIDDQMRGLHKQTIYCVNDGETDYSSSAGLGTLALSSPALKEYLDALDRAGEVTRPIQ